ncbi:hypothetical protein PoB_003017800 [Plakobranchus ocellatus]|uniref:Uncharacterized protein n=1 Tax=Plakobranchus ocellatus TaxID=259542 RepID=A0AAV4AAL0_9GAST|nr:hypothetical protein PoB_003017800 [Plakobranchus ocellatus]
MKEESNIAMGLLTTHKWQPSVLQLLPFSNNNVGVKRNMHGVLSDPYFDNSPDRGFPMLAVTRSENSTKPRSKSANVPVSLKSSQPEDSDERKFGRGQQRRLFRASSERLSRGAERTSATNGSLTAGSDKHKTKLRARSDYGISSFYKRAEVVKISVNDINEQILGGKKRVKSAVTGEDEFSSGTRESPEGTARARAPGESRSRGVGKEGAQGDRVPLPKSVLKPTPGRWPNTGLTFWSSAAAVPSAGNSRGTSAANQRTRAENEASGSSRGSTARGGEHYFRRDGRRVKLNVNELPRSKTPITDNDPDKLNMQHVIAFLQSSSSGQDGSENVRASETGNFSASRSGQHPSFPSKRSAINGVITASPDHNGLVSIRARQIAKRPDVSFPGKSIRDSSSEEPEVTPHRLSFNKNYQQLEEQKEQALPGSSSGSPVKPAAESLQLYRKTRVMPASNGHSLQYSDYKSHSVVLSEKLHHGAPGYPEIQDIHIPLSIRKIRDQSGTGDSKPFRLHRFLTLVPNGSETLLKTPEKCDRSAGGAAQPKPGSREKRFSERKGSGNEKSEKRFPVQRKSHPNSSLYYLDMSTPFNDRPQSKGDNQRRSKSRKGGRAIEAEAEQLRKDVQRVIKLPRAHFEAESDEEGSPYCTVPAARNKRALTLSAQGRAIKHIISENNNKLSVALHSADRQQSRREDPTEKPAIEDASTGLTKEAVDENNTPEKLEASESTPKENPPNISEFPADKTDPADSRLDLIQKPEVTTDQASAVTFRDMLDLKSDPGVSSASKEHSHDPTVPGSTTFLTQAPSSSSPTHSEKTAEQQRNSPSRYQHKSNKTELPPLPKAEGKMSTSSANQGSTSPTRDHVKLSLRKEKNKTREHTYMFEVDNEGGESLSPSPK